MTSQHILRINEIFTSIQGEGAHVGRPMHFVRISGCNLNCVYCDTPDNKSGVYFSIDEIIEKVGSPWIYPVFITGGEPLMQEESLFLIIQLLSGNREVHLETNGSLDLNAVAPKAIKSVDIKTPGSGAGGSFLESNLDFITVRDDIKFVITSKDDFNWAVDIIKEWRLLEKTPNLIFQPAWGFIEPVNLAEWVLSCGLSVRMGLQIHKFIWGPDAKGV